MDKEKVAKKIQKVLEMRKMSKAQLAELCGYQASTVSNIVSGRYVTPKMVRSVAEALQIDYDFLVGDTDNGIYKELDANLFSQCIALVSQIVTKENLKITNHNNLVELALNLYKRHQENITDIYKNPREAQSFIEGIIDYQLSLGVVKRIGENEEA